MLTFMPLPRASEKPRNEQHSSHVVQAYGASKHWTQKLESSRPARSTRCSLASTTSWPPSESMRRWRTCSVMPACERLLDAFSSVAAVVRLRRPRAISACRKCGARLACHEIITNSYHANNTHCMQITSTSCRSILERMQREVCMNLTVLHTESCTLGTCTSAAEATRMRRRPSMLRPRSAGAPGASKSCAASQ